MSRVFIVTTTERIEKIMKPVTMNTMPAMIAMSPFSLSMAWRNVRLRSSHVWMENGSRSSGQGWRLFDVFA